MNERTPAECGARVLLDRRELILGAAGAAAVAYLPFAGAALAAPVPVDSAAPSARLDDWTIDDMWGVYPRYAEPIPFPQAAAGPRVAAVDPVLDAYCA